MKDKETEPRSSCCGAVLVPIYLGREITKYRCSQCGNICGTI